MHLWGCFLDWFHLCFLELLVCILFFLRHCLCFWLLCNIKIIGFCLFHFLTFLPGLDFFKCGACWLKIYVSFVKLAFCSGLSCYEGCRWTRFSLFRPFYHRRRGSCSCLILFFVVWNFSFLCFSCRSLFTLFDLYALLPSTRCWCLLIIKVLALKKTYQLLLRSFP